MSKFVTGTLKVNYSTWNWGQQVKEEWGTYWSMREIAYEFSNGVRRLSTDTTKGGAYSPISFALQIEGDPNYPDMANPYLIQENGGYILLE
jgi:hypothetical protein